MKIKFSDKIFNPLYWHLKKYMADEKIRYILVFGGSSAAKTYSIVQAITIDAIKERDSYMILRKFGSDIEDSVFSDFNGIIERWNLRGIFTSIKNKIKCASGGFIRFRGLDDSEKIKGIARFKRTFMEEMSQFEHVDFKQIRKRLRGRPGQQIIGSWNPISEEHWIKKEIIDPQEWEELPKSIPGKKYSELDADSYVRINKSGNTILIRTTYKDNYWIVGHPDNPKIGFKDIHVLADFEMDRIHDYPYYRVYALGEWGKLDTGAEFYKSFNTANHIKPTEYNPGLPLHLSFDENVNPYLSCSIWQAEENHVRQIDEIAMETPRNTLQDVLTEFEKRYFNHRSGIYIYGDATSRKADAKLQKGYNFYSLIVKGLGKFNPQTRVALSNPPVMMRGIFINHIFQGRIQDVTITIGENCRKTIEDIRYTKQASDGTKLKEKTRDSKTGVTFEKYGHLSDTMDYFVCFYLSGKFSEFQHGDSTGKRLALKPNDGNKY